LKWGDYDHDSLQDLVINGIGSIDFRTRVYKNMGADSFLLQPFYMKGSGGTVDWADLDNDGWVDILVTGYDSTSGGTFTDFHHNNMNGTFSLVSTNLPDFGEPSGVAIADYNLDGSEDVCFIGGTSVFPSTGSALALNTSLNTYNVQPFFNGNIINPILETADMDNDGDYDLIFSNFILRNDNTANIYPMIPNHMSVSIYPNPAREKTFITASGIIESITISDISGKEIKSIALLSKSAELDLSGFVPGIYFLRINSSNANIFRKIVVLR